MFLQSIMVAIETFVDISLGISRELHYVAFLTQE